MTDFAHPAAPPCCECGAQSTCVEDDAFHCEDHRARPCGGTNIKTRAPTREEIHAHAARGGEWRVSGWYGTRDHFEILRTASDAESVAIPRWASPNSYEMALRWEPMLNGTVYDWSVLTPGDDVARAVSDESIPPVNRCDFSGDGDPGFCMALDTELRSPTSNLVQTWAIDATTGRRFWTGVGRQDGAHVIALNVCPWCTQPMVRA